MGCNENMSGANGGRILTYKGKDESNTPISLCTKTVTAIILPKASPET